MTIFVRCKLLLFALCLISLEASALSPDCNGGACTPLTTEEKQQILDIHNRLRAVLAKGEMPNHPPAADMNQLVWDDGLANVAQGYAETCPGLVHNFQSGAQYLIERDAGNTRWGPDSEVVPWGCGGNGCLLVGENMLGASAMLTIERAVQYIESLWWNEHYDWTFGPYDPMENCTGAACGHFTQMAWANTRYVGCGYVNGCSDWNLLVCNYFPVGNFVGDKPYDDGANCSNCMADREVCTDGLCGGPLCTTAVDGGTYNRATSNDLSICAGAIDSFPPVTPGGFCDEFDGCAVDNGIDWVDFEIGAGSACIEVSREHSTNCDLDLDGIPDDQDNCPFIANPDQTPSVENPARGVACEELPGGC